MYKDKRNFLEYRSKLLGPMKKYQTSDDFSLWFEDLLLRVKFCKFKNYEARIFLLSNINDVYIKKQVARVLQEHPRATLEELGINIAIALGSKSKELLSAESEVLVRKDMEGVHSFGLRCKDVRVSEALAYGNSKELIDSAYFQKQLLRTFQRGLRSRWMVE